MSFTIAQVARSMQTTLTAVADQAACDSGFVRRHRQLTGASFTQALVFGWLDNPQATLEDLATATTTVGTPVTAQALEQRFGPAAADCLRRILQQAITPVVAAQPLAIPLLQRFHGVYLLDSTTIALPACLAELWPGCGGRTVASSPAALKAQVRWDLTTAALDGLTLHAGRDAETHGPLSEAPLPAGALRLADLGYFDLDTFEAYGRQGVSWLTRLQPKTVLFAAGERVRGLAAWLKAQGQDRLDVAVEVGLQKRLPGRLLAVRVPPAVERQRQQRLRKKAQKKHRRPNPEQLVLCAWNLWITNVPVEKLSLEEGVALARCRWQIELLFKQWKSQGEIDQSRSGKPWRVLCEVYAKLLAMVIQHGVILVSWSDAAGRSLRKAARVVRRHALHFASVLGVLAHVRRVLRLLQGCLQRGPRINKRKRKPAAFQILLDPKRALPEEYSVAA